MSCEKCNYGGQIYICTNCYGEAEYDVEFENFFCDTCEMLHEKYSVVSSECPNCNTVVENSVKKNIDERIFFFDTETNGLPNNYKADIGDISNWPRVVQFAYQIFDIKGKHIKSVDLIIKPSGFIISDESIKIHKISNAKALNEGIEIEKALNIITSDIQSVSTIVAHNLSFDFAVINCEYKRLGLSNPLSGKKEVCTMTESTNYCAINSSYGFKWPKLSELHFKLFGTNFEEAHNAAYDINATSKCFWKLLEIGVIKLTKEKNENQIDSKKEKYFGETKEIYETLIKFCKENQLQPIPMAASAKAIGILEMKLKQSQQYIYFEDESRFLRDFWAKNEILTTSQNLKIHQDFFIKEIKKEIVENNLDLKLLQDKSFEESLSSIELYGVLYSIETDIPRKLVINLYYHYLTRYFDNVPSELKKQKMEKLPAITEIENKINSIFDKHFSDFKTSTNGGIPERIYNLVESVNIELKRLALISSNTDSTYIEYSNKIVVYSSSLILDWSKEMKQHLTIPISGMKLGNSFVEVCDNVFRKISEVETDEESKIILNEKIYEFSVLKLQISAKSNPKGGCFIATAVYGNYDHPSVLDLRLFRDKYLINTFLGDHFINWYYKNSPEISIVIRKKIYLRSLVYLLIVKPSHLFAKIIMVLNKK